MVLVELLLKFTLNNGFQLFLLILQIAKSRGVEWLNHKYRLIIQVLKGHTQKTSGHESLRIISQK